MAWLKKVGLIVLKATEIVTGLGPVLSTLIPGEKDDKIIQRVSVDLAQIAGIIAQAEVFGAALGLPGDQKLKAATPAVAQIILQSSLLVGHKIDQPAQFQLGCQKVADGMADILNSLDDKVETISKT